MWRDWVLRIKQLKVIPVSGVYLGRVCAISTYTFIIIIGIYLPATNSPLEEYNECLDVIECLINRHQGFPVIITGDFNANVGTEGGGGHVVVVDESYAHEHHPLNSSDHLPLSVHLSIPALCNSLTPIPPV